MADQEARDELRRLLDAAVGRMLMDGLGWDQVVDEVRRRLAEEPEIPADLWGIPVGATMRTGSRMWRRLDNGPSGQVRGEVVEYARVDLSGADAERRMLDRGEWPPRLDGRAPRLFPGDVRTDGTVVAVHDGRSLAEQLMQQEQGSGPGWPARPLILRNGVGPDTVPPLTSARAATVVEAAAPAWHAELDQQIAEVRATGRGVGERVDERVDEPGEPPVGSVVQDTRSRVCWRDEAGWHRSDGTEGGAERVLTWRDVCQAVGPDPQNPRQLKAMPGAPTVISQPPARAQVPMVTRPAGQLEVQVQHAVLGPDGEPLLGPNGQPLLKTETETVAISEVVPASEARP